MIRVGLVTNWQEACAVAEYANSLVTHTQDKEIEYKIITRPLTYEHILDESRNVDVLHFNCAWWLFDNILGKQWPTFRKTGKKVILTLHESYEPEILRYNGLGPTLDALVVHELPKQAESWPTGFYYVPQGIRLVSDLSSDPPEMKLGTLGFPFWWKNYQKTARVAKKLGLGFLALLGKPKSDPINLDAIAQEILDIHPKAEIEIGWKPYDYMVRRLRECLCTVFPYQEGSAVYGVSAGVRMGMAAGRPIVVSEHEQQFKDLYPDEIYRVHSDQLEEAVACVLQDMKQVRVKLPKRMLADMNWSRCAAKYVDLYKHVMNAQETVGEEVTVA